MIKPEVLFKALSDQGINFFTGVPDSLLKNFCAFVTDNVIDSQHIITANEGNAVALSAGHYLGTGKMGLVYLQNSGLGNTINPLLSLNDPEVYGLPVLLMIGWRGEPGIKDEPQHIKQGRISTTLLDAMEIPWHIIDSTSKDIEDIISLASSQALNREGPVALMIRKGTFSPYSLKTNPEINNQISREQAIQQLIKQLNSNDRVVVTTGMPARELYEFRELRGDNLANDFLTVGSMGHAASISLGLAISEANRRVICIDGDGSVLMHMGSLAIIGQSRQENLIHVVLNNGSHDSVGGQPTCALDIDLLGIAKCCGYRKVILAKNLREIEGAFNELSDEKGPLFLEIRIKKGSRENLGRPRTTPTENRIAFMENFNTNKSKI